MDGDVAAKESDVNRRICPSAESLDRLHAVHPWVPSSACIRPPPHVVAEKHAFMERQRQTYASVADSALAEVFGFPTRRGSLRDPHAKYAAVDVVRAQVLRPCTFPYDVPEGTHHSVQWFSFPPDDSHREPLPDDVISATIAENLRGVHLRLWSSSFVCRVV
jgi:hypothetical protein